jgi:hypothetical protein
VIKCEEKASIFPDRRREFTVSVVSREYLSDNGKLHGDLQGQIKKIKKEVNGKNKAAKLYDE